MIEDKPAVRPKVTVDGKELDRAKSTNQLSRKTLDVYKFLISNPGFHGVRNLQRLLNYASPGSVSYHLKRLLQYNLIIRTEEGKYGIFNDNDSTHDLAQYIGLMLKSIPKYSYYGLILLFTGLFILVGGFITNSNILLVLIGSVVPTLVGSLVIRQALEFASLLEEINELVLELES